MVRLVSEKNIPSLFSALQLMLSGSLLYLVYDQSKKKNVPRSICGFWKFLSIIFYILAFDEWFTIHDILGKLFSDGMGGLGDLFGWTLLYIILIPLFLLVSIRFLLAPLNQQRLALLLLVRYLYLVQLAWSYSIRASFNCY